MNDETREALIREAIALAGLAVAVLAMDQRFRITVRAAFARWRQVARAAAGGYHSGEDVAAWWMDLHRRRVITEAERIAREGDAPDG